MLMETVIIGSVLSKTYKLLLSIRYMLVDKGQDLNTATR